MKHKISVLRATEPYSTEEIEFATEAEAIAFGQGLEHAHDWDHSGIWLEYVIVPVTA